MTLKVELINGAFATIAISGVTVGASNEDNDMALSVLEDMAAELGSRNICTGYNIQDEPDLNDESNVPREFTNAFKTNLAVRLISAFGKQVPQTLMMQASQSMSNMSARTAQVRMVQAPRRMPRGSANTLRGNRWKRYEIPVNEAPISCATNIMAVGDIDDFVEHFDSYLKAGEDIDTFTIKGDNGVSVISSASSFTDVTYRVQAMQRVVTKNIYPTVTIVVNTTDGRVEKRIVNFTFQ